MRDLVLSFIALFFQQSIEMESKESKRRKEDSMSKLALLFFRGGGACLFLTWQFLFISIFILKVTQKRKARNINMKHHCGCNT